MPSAMHTVASTYKHHYLSTQLLHKTTARLTAHAAATASHASGTGDKAHDMHYKQGQKLSAAVLLMLNSTAACATCAAAAAAGGADQMPATTVALWLLADRQGPHLLPSCGG
jgi:hypothetical protein